MTSPLSSPWQIAAERTLHATMLSERGLAATSAAVRANLRRITMPVLNVYADGDVIIPNACSRGQRAAFGTRDYTELPVPGGHIGTFVGAKAQDLLAPGIANWLKLRNSPQGS